MNKPGKLWVMFTDGQLQDYDVPDLSGVSLGPHVLSFVEDDGHRCHIPLCQVISVKEQELEDDGDILSSLWENK